MRRSHPDRDGAGRRDAGWVSPGFLPRPDEKSVMLVIHATLPIDPDRREEALELIEDLAEQSRQEEGTVDYRATTEIGAPDTVRFFEQYEDEAALAAHAESDHYKELEAALPDLLAGEPEVLRFEVDGATELDL